MNLGSWRIEPEALLPRPVRCYLALCPNGSGCGAIGGFGTRRLEQKLPSTRTVCSVRTPSELVGFENVLPHRRIQLLQLLLQILPRYARKNAWQPPDAEPQRPEKKSKAPRSHAPKYPAISCFRFWTCLVPLPCKRGVLSPVRSGLV